MGVIREQLHLDADQRSDPKDRGQQMGPGVDEIIVQIEERPEAGGERVELASVPVPYVRVDLHPGWYFIPVEDTLGRCVRAGFCPRTRFSNHFWKNLSVVQLGLILEFLRSNRNLDRRIRAYLTSEGGAFIGIRL